MYSSMSFYYVFTSIFSSNIYCTIDVSLFGGGGGGGGAGTVEKYKKNKLHDKRCTWVVPKG